MTATAAAMAHHDDLLHLKDLDGEFQRGRNAMAAAAELQRRHEGGDVANREYLAGSGVEDGGGIGSAVGAGDHPHPGTLSLGAIGPALAFMFPARSPRQAIAGRSD